MERIKSTVVPGNLIYDYIKQFRYGEIDWNDIVTRLNNMDSADKIIVNNIIKHAWKAFFNNIRANLHPELDRIIRNSKSKPVSQK